MKVPGISILLALLGVGVFVVWSSTSNDAEPSVEVDAAERTADDRFPAEPATLEPREAPEERSSETAVEPSPVESQRREVAVAAPEPAGPGVARGRILVDEPDGTVSERANGSVRLKISYSELRETGPVNVQSDTRVRVEDGRWRLDVPGGTEIHLVEVSLGEGRVGFAEEDRIFPAPVGREHVLRARRLVATDVHVIAADTGAELDELEVYWIDPGLSFPVGYRVGERLLRVQRETTSPIELAPMSLVHNDFEIRREGYCHARFSIDALGGDPVVVTLEPAGALVVQRIGPRKGRFLRIRDGSGAVVVEGDNFREETLFEPLPAGIYLVSAEDDGPRAVYGTAEAVVVAGEDNRVVLQTQAEPHIEPATADVVLVIPPEWGIDEFSIELTAKQGDASDGVVHTEDITPVAGREGAWAFRLTDQRPGIYHLAIEPESPLGAYVTLPAGVSEHEIVIAPPCQVTVDVVDGETGEPADLSGLRSLPWSLPVPADTGFTSSRSSSKEYEYEHERPKGRFRFLAPRTTIVVTLRTDRYVMTREELPLEGEEWSGTISLHPRTAIVVRLLHGGEPIEDRKWQVKGWHMDDVTARVMSYGYLRDGRRLDLSTHGRYKLEFTKPPRGYLPIPDQEVEVGPREVLPLDIELVKKH